ncbi:D-alanyl-D-alanine carboxypeptidase [Candidatus Roizmanbacteria bacterium]|nr:D-alanyl-D-alanine carboxypeptidase [Candidatus Roizmanbacteria bacterium]
MKLRSYLLLAFYTLLFLFYPGDTYYYNLFAYNRPLFEKKETRRDIEINPVPYLKSPFYFPQTSAEGVYIVDLPSFTPILKRNEHSQFLPASTTKIITALVALDIYKPDQIITVKKVIEDGQIMGLVVGEKITVENLLYGTLVHSGNDAAYALADNFGYDKFVDLMNEKALNLHMNDSRFKNPAGLDENGQYSTPFDLALAARELLKNPYLSKIVSTKEIIISDVDFKYFHTLTNVNKLLGEISGLGGLKTGYTEEAGENLVSFYKKNGHQFIIVILKSLDRFSDTTNVIAWIDSNIDYIIIR